MLWEANYWRTNPKISFLGIFIFGYFVIDLFSVQNVFLIYSNVSETTENPSTDLDLSVLKTEIMLSLIKDKKQFTVSWT